MPRRRARRWGIWAGLALCLALPAGGERPDPLSDWADGPVRYLMTRAETKQFRQLKNPGERLDFIRYFWQRRDPNPRTPENEARLIFWQRVAEANRKFGYGGAPGWKTDRGKIYVLLGPPDDIDTKENYDATTVHRELGGRGLSRWKYARSPNGALTNFVVAFVRDYDNDWHLTNDAQFSSPFFDINRPTSEQAFLSNGTALVLQQVPWGASDLATAMDLGRLQEIPAEQDIMRAIVKAEGFLGTYAGSMTWHTRAGADGETLLALTVAVRRADLVPPWDGSATGLSQRFAVTAEVRPLGGPDRAAVDVPEDAWAPEPSPRPGDPWLRFQALRALPRPSAGTRWSVAAVVLDRPGGGAATVRGELAPLPDIAGAPRINGPILATQLIPASDPESPGTRPFRFPGVFVVPKMGSEHRSDEPFTLFLEVLPAPGSSAPVALEWRFERTAPGGAAPAAWGSPGRLEDARGPRAWQLKAGFFPPGHYTASFTASSPDAPPVLRSLTFSVLASDQ